MCKHSPILTQQWTTLEGLTYIEVYIDNGRSILRFVFLSSLTCFIIFNPISKRIVMHIKQNASRIYLKYSETADKTRKARIMSSHTADIIKSTLHS